MWLKYGEGLMLSSRTPYDGGVVRRDRPVWENGFIKNKMKRNGNFMGRS